MSASSAVTQADPDMGDVGLHVKVAEQMDRAIAQVESAVQIHGGFENSEGKALGGDNAAANLRSTA